MTPRHAAAPVLLTDHAEVARRACERIRTHWDYVPRHEAGRGQG